MALRRPAFHAALAACLILHLLRAGPAQPYGVDLLSAPRGASDVAVSTDGSTLYVLQPTEKRIYQVDASSGRLVSFRDLLALATAPVALECAKGKLYLLDRQNLVIIEPRLWRRLAALPLQSGSGPNQGSIVRAPDGLLYTVHYNGTALTVIDPVQDTLQARIPVGTGHTDVAVEPGGRRAFLHHERFTTGSTVNIVDLRTRRSLGRYPYHPSTINRSAIPPQIAAGATGVYVSYTRAGTNQIRVAHLDHAGTLVQTLAGTCFDERPGGVAVTPDEKYLVAGGSTVFERSTGRTVNCVQGPGGAHRAAPTADGAAVYFSNAGSLALTRFVRGPAPLAVSGLPRPGQTLTLRLDQLAAARLPYQLGAAFQDRPGIPVGKNRVLPLAFDALLLASVLTGNRGYFRDAAGALDGYGHGTVRVLLPPYPDLVGTALYFAYLTYTSGPNPTVNTVSAQAVKVVVR